MQNRSNRGLGKPVWVKAHQAREFDWDPIRRIALGPAVMCAASTGRRHDSTRLICTSIKIILAKREPSRHDPMYGSTVCCKSYFEIAVLVMRKCIRPRFGTFNSGPSWVSAHIRSHYRIGQLQPVGSPDSECAGVTVPPSQNSSRRPRWGFTYLNLLMPPP